MSAPEPTLQERRDEVDATRSELGTTVEQLAAKTAIKARLRDAGEQVKDHAARAGHEVAGRGRRIASNARHAASTTARNGVRGAKATAERRPVRAVAVGGASIALLAGWTLSRRTGGGRPIGAVAPDAAIEKAPKP